MIKNLLLAATALACTTASANAATYTGSRTIGTGSVNISITTDGTLGALNGSNITAYTIDLFNTDGTFTLTNTNSSRLLSGAGLIASATDLKFDFTVGGFALFQAPGIGSGGTFYCLQGNGGGCYNPTSVAGEAVEATNDYLYPYIGTNARIDTIATVAGAGAVPEPATWAMMIGGFGLVGGAMRRRSAAKVSFA